MRNYHIREYILCIFWGIWFWIFKKMIEVYFLICNIEEQFLSPQGHWALFVLPFKSDEQNAMSLIFYIFDYQDCWSLCVSHTHTHSCFSMFTNLRMHMGVSLIGDFIYLPGTAPRVYIPMNVITCLIWLRTPPWVWIHAQIFQKNAKNQIFWHCSIKPDLLRLLYS